MFESPERGLKKEKCPGFSRNISFSNLRKFAYISLDSSIILSVKTLVISNRFPTVSLWIEGMGSQASVHTGSRMILKKSCYRILKNSNLKLLFYKF